MLHVKDTLIRERIHQINTNTFSVNGLLLFGDDAFLHSEDVFPDFGEGLVA